MMSLNQLFMKQKFAMLTVLFLMTSLFACDSTSDDADPPLSEGQISILPLGDSRVQGEHPIYESYRYELWKNLVGQNLDIDFVGPETDDAIYPEFMDRSFDNDHAGIGGDTTTDVLNRMDQVLRSTPGPPQIVLLGIGGNDLLDGAPTSDVLNNIHTIIDCLQANNPEVTIIVEQIAPGESAFMMDQQLVAVFNAFNDAIPTLASQQSDSASTVLAVDMSLNWTDAYLADAVHYNEAGAKVVADRYFAAIEDILAQ